MISLARSRRVPRNGQLHCTVMSSTAIRCMLRSAVLPGRDFNGASWRRMLRAERRCDSTKTRTFRNTNLPIPSGPSTLWRPGTVAGEWWDVCDFLKPLESQSEWHSRQLLQSIARYGAADPKISHAIMKYGYTLATSTRAWWNEKRNPQSQSWTMDAAL